MTGDSLRTAMLRSLLQNDTFKNLFINRFADHINTIFTPNRITKIVTDMYEIIKPELNDHFNRWGIEATNQYNFNGWIDFAKKRPDFMKEHIIKHFNLDGLATIQINVSDTSSGYVRINTIDLHSLYSGVSGIVYPWEGQYFKGVPITLIAKPQSGYVFSHWSGYTNSLNDSITIYLSHDLQIKANFKPIPSSDNNSKILHFWLMNSKLPNNQPLDSLAATYTNQLTGGKLYFHSAFLGYPFSKTHPNWRKSSMERRNSPTPINYFSEVFENLEFGKFDMRGVQIRQPFVSSEGENMIEFEVSTIGYNSIKFSLAAMDEDAVDVIYIEYWDVDEKCWMTNGIVPSKQVLGKEYKLLEFDFNRVKYSDNNPAFKFRLRFDGPKLVEDVGNRICVNNIAIQGKAIPKGNLPAPKIIAVQHKSCNSKAQIKLADLPEGEYTLTLFPDSITITDKISVKTITLDGDSGLFWFKVSDKYGNSSFESDKVSLFTLPLKPKGNNFQSFTLYNGNQLTLNDLAIEGSDIRWFLNLEEAKTGRNELSNKSVLVSGQTYYAVNKFEDCYSLPLPVTVAIKEIQLADPIIKENNSDTLCYYKNHLLLKMVNFTSEYNDLLFMWEESDNGIDFKSIKSQTDTLLNLFDLVESTWFRLRATSEKHNFSIYSNVIKINVDQPLKAGVLPGEFYYYTSKSSNILRLKERPVGGSRRFRYEWYRYDLDKISYNKITDATQDTLVLSSLYHNDFYVKMNVIDSCGLIDSTNFTLVKIVVNPSISVSNHMSCKDFEAEDLYLEENPEIGSYRYVWQKSVDNVYYDSIGNGLNYKPGTISRKTWYRVIAKSPYLETLISNVIFLDTYDPVYLGGLSSDLEICYNANPGKLKIDSISGGSGDFSYQWFESLNNKDFYPINNATEFSFEPGFLKESIFYRLEVTDKRCSKKVVSNSVFIKVKDKFSPGFISGSDSICYNHIPGTIFLSKKPSGGFGKYSFQWFQSTDNINFEQIEGANDSTYIPDALKVTTFYKLKVIDSCETTLTNSVEIIVAKKLNIETISNCISAVCYNSLPGDMFVEISGGKGKVMYEWEISNDNKDFMKIEGAENPIYNHGIPLKSTTYFRVRIMDECVQLYSDIFTVNVNKLPDSLQITGEKCVCSDQVVEYRLLATPADDIDYNWSVLSGKGYVVSDNVENTNMIRVLWSTVKDSQSDTIRIYQENKITGCVLVQDYIINILEFEAPEQTEIIRKGNSSILIRKDGESKEHRIHYKDNVTMNFLWGFTNRNSNDSDTIFNHNYRYIDFAYESQDNITLNEENIYWVEASFIYKVPTSTSEINYIKCPKVSYFSVFDMHMPNNSQMYIINPNPNQGVFNIKPTNEHFENLKITIFSLTGEIIYIKKLDRITQFEDLIEIKVPKGIYIVQFEDEIRNRRQKLYIY